MNDDYKDVSGLLEDDVSKVEGDTDMKVGTDEIISADEKVSVADKIDIGDKIDIIKPIVPIKPIRMPKLSAMRTMAEYSIPTPVTRKEMYLNVIAGGVSALPTPITREEIYLAKICGMDVAIPIPLTRYEMYLYKLAGGEWDVPTPVTRLEKYLYHNCGFEIEIPEPITREEIYWNGGQPQPTTIEGVPPLTFTAKRTGNLEGYTICGNTVQSGTPTPDNPIMPQGTGERTGNLFDKDSTTIYSAYFDASGSWALSADSKSVKMPCQPNTQYTLSVPNSLVVFRVYESSNANIEPSSTHPPRVKEITRGANISQYTFTTSSTAQIVLFQGSNGSVTEWFNSLMLNEGSTALPYEPYGYKIPISSNSTTTPVYLGQVQSTRRIKKLVLTGEEGTDFYRKNTTSADNSLYYIRFSAIQSAPLNGSPLYCTHLPNINYTPSYEVGITVAFTYNVIYFNLGLDVMNAQPSGNTVAGLKEYLATQYANGTPVTIWYVLANEETAVVNEPLMKIGDYADTLSMEQAGVEIPVTAGTNTLSVGTEIQPSNMMISYK